MTVWGWTRRRVCRQSGQKRNRPTQRTPERYAQEALGHNSKAVHRAYARNAQVVLPSLDEYEKAQAAKKIVAADFKVA
jgi:hypothetical protein